MKKNVQRFIENMVLPKEEKKLAILGLTEASFIRNSFGHLRNDISKLLDANNLLSYHHALDTLMEIRKNAPDMSKFTKDQLYSMIKPKWVQTAQQNIEFEQFLDSQQIEWLEALKPKDEEVTEPATTPASAPASAPVES